jgi:hypothetical protein
MVSFSLLWDSFILIAFFFFLPSDDPGEGVVELQFGWSLAGVEGTVLHAHPSKTVVNK